MYTKANKSKPGYKNVQKKYKNVQKVHKYTKKYTNVHKSTQKSKRYLKVQKGTTFLIFPTVYYMLTTLLLYEDLQSSSKIGKFHFIIRTVERSRESESCTLES